MQDGAAPHTAKKTKEVLKKQFSDVIGLGFQSNWPSHSPDLTPFFLWGYLKEKVYSPSVAPPQQKSWGEDSPA